MTPQLYDAYYEYLSVHVVNRFYQDRLVKLQSLKLSDILKRKNPYLFKAKNIEFAGDFVRNIVDAFLSSQEETIFGNLLETFAIYVSNRLYSGFKSGFKSVDLEFQRGGVYFLVGIKSGTNWGNADQINAMKNNFKAARIALREEDHVQSEIVAVNGCMYGTDRSPLKANSDPDKVYFKYAGQDFWRFVSDDDSLYQQMIVPIDQEAKKKDEAFKTAYTGKVNEMTAEFMAQFMTNNQIDWVRLVDFVSKRRE